ncbi:MAG: hypothetical protein K8M05_03440 [Deltaproteobacteria bacterium]|nr:hypothetical protein [Kofleriaceae bacterium]
MRTWGIAFLTSGLLVTLAAAPARAEDPKSFEALARTAEPLARADLAGLVWSLTTPCNDGDELAQRQCKAARDARAAAVRDATFVVDGDGTAFAMGAWKAESKSAPITLRGCIACAEPVGGLYLVSSKAAPSFKGATAEAAVVHETARTFKDEAAAKRWATRLPQLRTQFVVKVAAAGGGMWERDGKKGLALDVLAFRVFDPCDGGIVCASPPSGKGPTDKKTCGESVVEGEPAGDRPKVDAPRVDEPAVPAQLDARDIKTAMQPVVEAARACFDTYGVAGSAKMVYAVGGDGSILAYEQTGDFVDTPTGKCIDKAARAVTFPKSKKKRFGFSYPLTLQ